MAKSITIEDTQFDVPDDIPLMVWDLMLRLSMERDYYKERLREYEPEDAE